MKVIYIWNQKIKLREVVELGVKQRSTTLLMDNPGSFSFLPDTFTGIGGIGVSTYH
jgi:hypothetical protein